MFFYETLYLYLCDYDLETQDKHDFIPAGWEVD